MGVGGIVEVDAAFEHGVGGYAEVAADRGHGRGRVRKCTNSSEAAWFGPCTTCCDSSNHLIYSVCYLGEHYRDRAESWQFVSSLG